MIGGFLGGLANAGRVVQGADEAQGEALKRAIIALQLRQAQEQDQATALAGRALPSIAQGGGIPGGGLPQGMPPYQPGQVQQQPLLSHSMRRVPPQQAGGLPQGGEDQIVKGSWFGNQPGWVDKMSGPQTASGRPLSEPGIALPSRATLGQEFDVTPPSGQTMRLPQTDVGPAAWTGRGVDINSAAAERMGYTPQNFPTDQPFKIHPVVKQELMRTGLEAVRAGFPAPAVRDSMSTAKNATSDLDPARFGSYGLPEIAQAIEKTSPDAPPAVKYLAAAQLHKLLAPDQQQMLRLLLQQQKNELTTAFKSREFDLRERSLAEREQHDRAMEGRPTAADRPNYIPFQTDEGVKAFETHSGTLKGLAGAEGMTRIGTAGPGAREGEQLFQDLKAARASGDPAAVKAAVQAITDHNMALGKGVGTRGGAQAMYMAQVKQEHPEYTAPEVLAAIGEYRRINALESGFASGIMGRNVVALNTVADHLKLAREYFDALGNGQIPRANQIANLFAVELGKPEVTSFNAGRDIMTGEVVRLLTSTGGTENDRKEMRSVLPNFLSPEQGKGVLTAFDRFVAGRFDALQQEYAQNDPKREARFHNDMLTSDARDLYDRTKGQKSGGGGQPQAGGAYNTEADVLQAIESGSLSREAGTKMLIDKFGYAPKQ